MEEMPDKNREELIEEFRQTLKDAKVYDLTIEYMLKPGNIEQFSDEELVSEIKRYRKIALKATDLDKRIKNLPNRIEEIGNETAAEINRRFEEIDRRHAAKLKDKKTK